MATKTKTPKTSTFWKKDKFGVRSVNAEIFAPTFPEHLIPDGQSFDYEVLIEKIDGKWVVYATEHEPEDLDDYLSINGEQVPNGFKKLVDAETAAMEFAKHFALTLADAWFLDECKGLLEEVWENGRFLGYQAI